MSIGQTLESAEMRAVIRERDELLRDRDGVTVCIPCFNQSEYLQDALYSVDAQTVAPIEVIVVDDGSTGGHGEHIEFHTESFGYRYVHVTNRGLPSARNTGLMLARGRAFLPLDADDWIDPTYIEKTLPLLEDADVVLTGIQEHGVRNGTYMPGFDMDWRDVTRDHLLRMNRFFYCSLMCTELLRSVGGWNGRRTEGYEDWSLWIDLMTRDARFAACPEPLFNYRTRHDSMLAETERNREAVVAGIRREHHLG